MRTHRRDEPAVHARVDLTGLFVADNAVADLSPLRRLSRLPALGLRGNRITDAAARLAVVRRATR